MDKKTKEKLVKLIGNGHISYKDIKDNLPCIIELELESMVRQPPSNIDCLVQCSANIPLGQGNYHFLATDTFSLTSHGKDLLYEIQKEELVERHFKETMSLNRKVYIIAIIGAIIGVLGLIVSLLKG